jgi:hypothetical protein
MTTPFPTSPPSDPPYGVIANVYTPSIFVALGYVRAEVFWSEIQQPAGGAWSQARSGRTAVWNAPQSASVSWEPNRWQPPVVKKR